MARRKRVSMPSSQAGYMDCGICGGRYKRGEYGLHRLTAAHHDALLRSRFGGPAR